MKAFKQEEKSTTRFSPDLRDVLYRDTVAVDYCGFSVYDAVKRKVGYVSEVYIDNISKLPRYIYIDHVQRANSRHTDFVYPYDEIRIVGNCRIYLNVTLAELEEFEVYHPEYVFSQNDLLMTMRESFAPLGHDARAS